MQGWVGTWQSLWGSGLHTLGSSACLQTGDIFLCGFLGFVLLQLSWLYSHLGNASLLLKLVLSITVPAPGITLQKLSFFIYISIYIYLKRFFSV